MRILSFDVETTSLDLETARIVDLGMVQYDPIGGHVVAYAGRFDPGCPIPAAATEVHGIRNVDVAGCPSFAEEAQVIQEALFGSILAGFNIRRFDVPILDAELRRAGQPGVDFDRVREIDAYRIWFNLEPRNLEGAVKRFAPDYEPEDVHAGAADALSTCHVLAGMADEWDLTPEAMESVTRPENEVDRFGKFVYDDDGVICFNFGKHKGKPAMSEQSYLQWMISSSATFHPQIVAVVKDLLFQRSML